MERKKRGPRTPRPCQKRELNTFTLKISKGPEEFGTNISRLGIEYKHKLPEEDKVTALVGTAGPKYVDTIFNTTRFIESKDREVTCEALVTACC